MKPIQVRVASLVAIAGIVGLVVGVLVGRTLLSPPPASPLLTPSPAPPPAALAPTATAMDQRGIPPKQPRPVSQGPSTPSTSSAEVLALQARVAELEARLAESTAAADAHQHVTGARPEGLDPRFEGKAIDAAVTEAFRELNVAGRVTAVDCSEYPCLVLGETDQNLGDSDASDRLFGSHSLAAYNGDTHTTMSTSSTAKDGTRKAVFGIAIYPHASGTEGSRVTSSLQQRFAEMQEDGQ